MQSLLRFEVMEANLFCRRLVVSYGYDILDTHYHLRMQIHRYNCFVFVILRILISIIMFIFPFTGEHQTVFIIRLYLFVLSPTWFSLIYVRFIFEQIIVSKNARTRENEDFNFFQHFLGMSRYREI